MITHERVSIIENLTGSGILDTETALKRVDGNRDLYNKILETFIKKHAHDHVQVIKNLEDGDTEAARRVMHSLKGVAQIVGSNDLHKVSIEIDLLLLNKEFSALQELLESFKKMLSEVINRIQIHLDKTGKATINSQQTSVTSREQTLHSVEYLAELIRKKDMEATRKGGELVGYLSDTVSTSHIAELQKNLDSLDFNNAASTLQSIKQQIMAAD